MHSLIITAHPSSQGFSHSIAKQYSQAKQSLNRTTEIIDLYTTDLKQDFLFFEDVKHIVLSHHDKIWRQKIQEANEIVFVFPMRRGDCPAILKNWIDNNFGSGFAYNYSKGFPVGLLKGKTAKIFVTCDGPHFVYRFFPISLYFFRRFIRIGFCGIQLKNLFIFDNMRKKKKKGTLNLLLQKVKKIGLK